MVKKHALVISHERSGTHLLINSLSCNFGFETGRIDVDYHLVANILESTLTRRDDRRVVLKSHHSIGFFPLELREQILKHFHVFYIYRDGRDVMTSFWYFLNKLQWNEGPKVKTVGEFMRHEPEGLLMRYQLNQYPHMLARWKAHVEAWISLDKNTFCFIRYEDLMQNFETIIKNDIANFLGKASSDNVMRPPMNLHTIYPWRGKVDNWKEFFTQDDIDFFEAYAGEVNRKLEKLRN